MTSDRRIREGIIVFWTIWFGVVLLTNVMDGLKALSILPAEWPFASGNRALIHQVIDRYSPTQSWVDPLFAGVILWEMIIVLLFARTLCPGWSTRPRQQALRTAFAAALGLWASFLIVDELFVAYDVEATHWRLLLVQLVTLLYVELPSEEPHSGP